jgi:adenylate cyclase
MRHGDCSNAHCQWMVNGCQLRPCSRHLSHTYAIAWTNRLDDDHLNPAALDHAYQFALKTVALDPNLPVAYAHFGSALTWKRQLDAALAEFQRAIALNPNFTDWRLTSALIYAGEPGRAIDLVHAHMRLDPYYHPMAPGWLGLAHCQLGRYADALAPLREFVSRMPRYKSAHTPLAATYAQLGLLKGARAEIAEVHRMDPKHTIEGYYRRVAPYQRTADAEHLFDGLRKAGLQEK